MQGILINKFGFNREEIVKDFFDRVNSINDEDIREFVNKALESSPREFWYSKSSSSGKNHPPENNINDVGLLVHLIKAMEVGERLFAFFGIESEIEKDIIRASIILHDLYKNGLDWENGFYREHGKLCAEKIDDYDLQPYIKEKIKENIETHMSRWAYPLESMKKFVIPNNMQLIVALADYISSRKEISFYPNISIIEEGDE